VKKQSILLTSALMLSAVSLTAQTVETIEPGPFDGGRLRTNAAIDFHAFNQWITPNSNPGNVGWNPNGIWYSFLRFPNVSGEAPVSNPDLFNKLAGASSVTLDLGVLWNEVDAALVGTVDPGVRVSMYLVPGLDVPEGELPTWTTTWLGEFTDVIKFGEIIPGEAPTTSESWQDSQDNPPSLEDREAARVSYDMTEALASAIADGLMDESTLWGIVFYTEEAEPPHPQRSEVGRPSWHGARPGNGRALHHHGWRRCPDDLGWLRH